MTTCTRCLDEGVTLTTHAGLCVAQRCACGASCDRCQPHDRGWRVRLWRRGQDGAGEHREIDQDRTSVLRAEQWIVEEARQGRHGWYTTHSRCTCATALGVAERITDIGIPAALAHATLRTYRTDGGVLAQAHREVERVARDWRSGSRGVLLTGGPGTGKTHLLCGLGRVLATRGAAVRYVDAGDLVIRMREARWSLPSHAAEREAEVLLLDELGRTSLDARERDAVTDLIFARHAAGRTTCVATNLQLDAPRDRQRDRQGDAAEVGDAASALGARLVSRLHEMCVVIRVLGADWRRKGVA